LHGGNSIEIGAFTIEAGICLIDKTLEGLARSPVAGPGVEVITHETNDTLGAPPGITRGAYPIGKHAEEPAVGASTDGKDILAD
jgi:hypothetical protein